MQSKAWITLLQWKSWKNPLQLMPSDPAASVCLNMWSAGRGTLDGDNPRAAGPLEVLLPGWVEAGWICMWDACMTWLSHQKPASGAGEGFGKASPGFPRPRHSLGVCAHLATFSGALAIQDSVCKVKVVKGKNQPTNQTNTPTEKEKGCILHKWESSVQLTQTWASQAELWFRRGSGSSAKSWRALLPV